MLNLYSLSLDDYLEIIEEAIALGKERGKKAKESIEVEFFEVAKKRGFLDNIKHLGTTEQDIDLLTGNLREKGLKVLNLQEEERRNEKI